MYENENIKQAYIAEKMGLEADAVSQAIPENVSTDSPEEKRLKRELQSEALTRLEEAARTPEDFKEVIKWWDRLDANRERKERYHEISRGDNLPLDFGAADGGISFPRGLNNSIWKQIQKGQFLDAIYNCPFEMHELVTAPYLSKIIKELSDEQKELLYYIAIREYSTAKIAQLRGQTDRNIRKVRNTMLKKIWKKMYEYLISEKSKNHSLTIEEKAFLKEYKSISKKMS